MHFRWGHVLNKKNPSNLSVQRAKAINWTDINIWFRKYKEVIDELGITGPERIFNIDEHGTEHHAKVNQVIGKKCSRSYQLQYGEKPTRSTMLTFVRGDGVAIAPMVIHRGTRIADSWHRDKPEGNWFT